MPRMSLEIYILEGSKELTSEAGTAYPSGTPPVFSGVRVTRSLVLYVCFVDRCLSFCTFSFGMFLSLFTSGTFRVKRFNEIQTI
jgi:hypothetical protein